MNSKKAYNKIDNHCCYNSLNVEFVKDDKDFPKDTYEVIDCLEQIEKDLKKFHKIKRIYKKSQKDNDYSADDAICDIGEVLENDK